MKNVNYFRPDLKQFFTKKELNSFNSKNIFGTDTKIKGGIGA